MESRPNTSDAGEELRELTSENPQLAPPIGGAVLAIPTALLDEIDNSRLLSLKERTAERRFTNLCVRHGFSGVSGKVAFSHWALLPEQSVRFRGEGSKGSPTETIVGRARSYAGQLLTNGDYLKQWYDIVQKHGSAIGQLGYPLVRVSAMQVHVDASKPERMLRQAVWEFTSRWCLWAVHACGIPEPFPPLQPCIGSLPVLHQIADMGVLLVVPWYFVTKTDEPLLDHHAIDRLQRQRDRGMDALAGEHAGQSQHPGLEYRPEEEATLVNWVAAMESEDPTRKSTTVLRAPGESSTPVYLEDLLKGSPSLLPGARQQEGGARYALCFPSVVYGSALANRYPQLLKHGLRGRFRTCVSKALEASERSFNRVSASLRPTSNARHQLGLCWP